MAPYPAGLQWQRPDQGVVRAGRGCYWQHALAMAEPDDFEGPGGGLGRCCMVVHSQDNLGGRIPKPLQNAAARQGVPGYVRQLEKAAVELLVAEGRVTFQEAKEYWSY